MKNETISGDSKYIEREQMIVDKKILCSGEIKPSTHLSHRARYSVVAYCLFNPVRRNKLAYYRIEYVSGVLSEVYKDVEEAIDEADKDPEALAVQKFSSFEDEFIEYTYIKEGGK